MGYSHSAHTATKEFHWCSPIGVVAAIIICLQRERYEKFGCGVAKAGSSVPGSLCIIRDTQIHRVWKRSQAHART